MTTLHDIIKLQSGIKENLGSLNQRVGAMTNTAFGPHQPLLEIPAKEVKVPEGLIPSLYYHLETCMTMTDALMREVSRLEDNLFGAPETPRNAEVEYEVRPRTSRPPMTKADMGEGDEQLRQPPFRPVSGGDQLEDDLKKSLEELDRELGA